MCNKSMRRLACAITVRHSTGLHRTGNQGVSPESFNTLPFNSLTTFPVPILVSLVREGMAASTSGKSIALRNMAAGKKQHAASWMRGHGQFPYRELI